MSVCQVTRWDDALYIATLHKQCRAVIKGEPIPCRCGTSFGIPKHLDKIFRCFFCGEWFCRVCGVEHFGKTGEIFQDGSGI